MKGYLWHIDGNLRHHLRAESVDEARQRIAATHGDDVARRAVIQSLEARRAKNRESAAA